MPLRRTERSDGRTRPRWKDGSHVHDVENTRAHDSRRFAAVDERTLRIERLVAVPWLLHGTTSNSPQLESTQPMREQTPGCKRSLANGEVRLAILPYGMRY